MLAKTIKYTDYDGNDRSEVFYFNFTPNEASTFMFKWAPKEDFQDMINRLMQNNDRDVMWNLFTDLILTSVGEKSSDGRRFIKKAPDGTPFSEIFSQMPAYDELLEELVNTPGTIREFMTNLLPKKYQGDAERRFDEVEKTGSLSSAV